jgi:hypothetical protein
LWDLLDSPAIAGSRKNLARAVGRPYQYLLYGDRDTWRPSVESFRRLVAGSDVPVELTQENLEFRCLSQELISSVCILDLDLPPIERQEPIL